MNENQLEKKNLVAEIAEKLTRAKSLVVAEYAGSSVAQMQQLRRELGENKAEIKVYKNRLFKIAAKEKGFDALLSSLTGPNVFAFGFEDDIIPAKTLNSFAEKHKVLKIKAGIYEGKVVAEEEVLQIAKLPSISEALNMLATAMVYPLKQMVIALNMLNQEKTTRNEKTTKNIKGE